MRILLVNQVFYPDVAATAQHGHDLARHLVRAGHEVHVVASRSIYGSAGAALPHEDTTDGIRIHRVARSLFGKAGILLRSADFALFYAAAALKAVTLPRADVVVCFTTPPFIGLVGAALRALRSSRFVYWSMDLYPDLPVACGVLPENGLAHRFFEALNRFTLRRADKVVALGRCMEARIAAKGIEPSRIERIAVWSDMEEVRPVPREANSYRRRWGAGDRYVVMYSGNLGLGHDVTTMAEAARLLAAKGSDVLFAFVGGGKRRADLEAALAARGVTGAVLEGYQPREKLDELLSAADAHLITLGDGIEGIMVPSKLYGVLAAARPALFVGGASSEIARVIDEERCGVTVPCGDAASLAEAIERLARDRAESDAMGRRGREALETKYAASIACEHWRRLLESLAPAAAAS